MIKTFFFRDEKLKSANSICHGPGGGWLVDQSGWGSCLKKLQEPTLNRSSSFEWLSSCQGWIALCSSCVGNKCVMAHCITCKQERKIQSRCFLLSRRKGSCFNLVSVVASKRGERGTSGDQKVAGMTIWIKTCEIGLLHFSPILFLKKVAHLTPDRRVVWVWRGSTGTRQF